jgi:hypothetical protein
VRQRRHKSSTRIIREFASSDINTRDWSTIVGATEYGSLTLVGIDHQSHMLTHRIKADATEPSVFADFEDNDEVQRGTASDAMAQDVKWKVTYRDTSGDIVLVPSKVNAAIEKLLEDTTPAHNSTGALCFRQSITKRSS